MNTTQRPARNQPRGRRSGKRKELMKVPQVDQAAQTRLRTLLSEGTYIVFDIETTGGNPEKNGITEIFAIRYSRGEVLGTFYSMVNPGIPIPPIVRRMTGINNQMVRNEPRIDQVMPGFVEFIAGDVLVSHNTIGDMKFVRHFAKQTVGIDMENFYLCTHLLVEKLAPETPDKSLRGLAEYFKLASGELHRAEADAYVTLELFKVLLGRLEARSVRRIDEAVRLQGDLESGMRLGWGIPGESLTDVPPGPGVFYLMDHDDQPLFFASSLHLGRDAGKLKVFHQLPRQLLRLVLKSANLKTTPTANVYAALLAEASELARQTPAFHPSGLHQRTVQTLFVSSHEGGELQLSIGPLEQGATAAYGPVRDRRLAGELLDQLAALAQVKVGRHGLRLPQHYTGPVMDLLNLGLPKQIESLSHQRRSLKLWFNPKARRQLSQTIELMQSLAQIRLPPRLAPLLGETGAIVVPGQKGTWQVHLIVASRPAAMQVVSGDIERELWHNGLAAQLAAELARLAGAGAASPHALSQLEADQANATLWWLYNGRLDGRFIPLAQLQGTPLNTPAGPPRTETV